MAVGETLGRLVAADFALHKIDLGHCGLSDDALRPLFAAAAQSTRLRTLLCENNDISPDFVARGVVLPASRSNVSLRIVV